MDKIDQAIKIILVCDNDHDNAGRDNIPAGYPQKHGEHLGSDYFISRTMVIGPSGGNRYRSACPLDALPGCPICNGVIRLDDKAYNPDTCHCSVEEIEDHYGVSSGWDED